jgi:hypothetical protein
MGKFFMLENSKGKVETIVLESQGVSADQAWISSLSPCLLSKACHVWLLPASESLRHQHSFAHASFPREIAVQTPPSMTFSLGMYVDGTLCKWAVHLHPEVMAN